MGNNLGVIALISGLLGFLFGFIVFMYFGVYDGSILGIFPPYDRYILPVIAIVAGVIGLKVDDKKNVAVAGIIIGTNSLLFVLFILPFLMNVWGMLLGFGTY